jgi:hypothetical protein
MPSKQKQSDLPNVLGGVVAVLVGSGCSWWAAAECYGGREELFGWREKFGGESKRFSGPKRRRFFIITIFGFLI